MREERKRKNQRKNDGKCVNKGRKKKEEKKKGREKKGRKNHKMGGGGGGGGEEKKVIKVCFHHGLNLLCAFLLCVHCHLVLLPTQNNSCTTLAFICMHKQQ